MRLRELGPLNATAIERCLSNVINRRLAEINFYRDVPLTTDEAEEKVEGWLREALFPATPRVKDKPSKGAK